MDNTALVYYINIQVKDKNQIDNLDVDNTTKTHLRVYVEDTPGAWFFIFKIPCVDEKSTVTLKTEGWGTGIVFDENGTVCVCLRNVHDIPQDAI